MSDNTSVDDIARRVAARLACHLDPALPEQVERELDLLKPPKREPITISLGALIVSIATLGWTVYHDLKKDRAAASQDEAKEVERLAAGMRAKPEAAWPAANLAPEQHQLIIAAVAEEIVRSQV
jgi:hypothetical protein